MSKQFVQLTSCFLSKYKTLHVINLKANFKLKLKLKHLEIEFSSRVSACSMHISFIPESRGGGGGGQISVTNSYWQT